MSVTLYKYDIPIGANIEEYSVNYIFHLYNNLIDENYVQNKMIIQQIPDWCTEWDGTIKNDILLNGLSFSYHGTDIVITATKTTNNFYDINLYAKNSRKVRSTNLFTSLGKIATKKTTWELVVALNSDYLLIKKLYASNDYLLVIRIDNPVMSNDTNTYVSFLPYLNEGTYNKSYNGEDINVPVYLAVDFVIHDNLYRFNSSFIYNYYNNKLLLVNVYAFTERYGIRGKISNLITAFNGLSTAMNKIYYVNDTPYLGLGSINVDNLKGGYFKTFLLKVDDTNIQYYEDLGSASFIPDILNSTQVESNNGFDNGLLVGMMLSNSGII